MRQELKKWIFGAGAQGRVTLEVWGSAVPDGDFSFIDDDHSLHGKVVNGVPIVGGFEFILDHFGPADEVIVAMGNNQERMVLGGKLEAKGLTLGKATHTSTVIMESAPGSANTLSSIPLLLWNMTPSLKMVFSLVREFPWVGG
jgi:FlaA1/EpsC-like NDP-sugar epimerase